MQYIRDQVQYAESKIVGLLYSGRVPTGVLGYGRPNRDFGAVRLLSDSQVIPFDLSDT